MSKTVNFEIEKLDPLGQGVFKREKDIFFISKTLPGETGQARVFRSAKGVHFATLESDNNLEKKSQQRVAPECEHFQACQGCHFLHCSYEDELAFKKQAFLELIKKVGEKEKFKIQEDWQDIPIQAAPSRMRYRNRIQLHYDKKRKVLGFINSSTKKILPIPECELPLLPIKNELRKLYEHNSWLKLVEKHSTKGHIELYLKPNEKKVSIAVNKRYSSGGFTQVNQEMNDKLVSYIHQLIKNKSTLNNILELFGGNGNLTRGVEAKKIFVIDSFANKVSSPNQEFFQVNLDRPLPIESYRQFSSEVMIIDPPRKGFQHIEQWVTQIAPKFLFYISCHPATMIRDIGKILEHYHVTDKKLFDLFPGTHHFESIVVLQRKSDIA